MNPLPLHFWLIDWLKLSESRAREVCVGLERALHTNGGATPIDASWGADAPAQIGLPKAVLIWRDYQVSLSHAQAGGIAAISPNKPALALQAERKRALLAAKCRSESAFALSMYLAKLADEAQLGSGDSTALIGLLTPLAQASPSAAAYDHRSALLAQELLAGKVYGDAGAALVILLRRIAQTAQAAAQCAELAEFAPGALEQGAALAKSALPLGELARQGDVASALANASLFLHALSTVCACWLMLDQALCAKRLAHAEFASLANNCRYLHRYELPNVRTAVDLLSRADRTCLDTDLAWF